MSYHIPSDKELVDYVDNSNTFIMVPNTDDCLNLLIRDLTTSIGIAKMNIKLNRDYYYFLKHFLRYVEISKGSFSSPLRRKFDDYLKLRKLNEIL